jgi:hypothetical protein
MFAIIKDNAFERFLPEGIAFKIGNTVYAQDWLNLSTPAEKAALGIVDVVYAQRPDDKYYWVTELPPTYNAATKQVDVAYTSIAKDLAGCVKQAVDAVNVQAYSILLPTDWMAVKAFETGSVVAEDWAAWRQEIRVQAAQAISDIEVCVDVEALAALPSVIWANDPNWVEPITEAVE